MEDTFEGQEMEAVALAVQCLVAAPAIVPRQERPMPRDRQNPPRPKDRPSALSTGTASHVLAHSQPAKQRPTACGGTGDCRCDAVWTAW